MATNADRRQSFAVLEGIRRRMTERHDHNARRVPFVPLTVGITWTTDNTTYPPYPGWGQPTRPWRDVPTGSPPVADYDQAYRARRAETVLPRIKDCVNEKALQICGRYGVSILEQRYDVMRHSLPHQDGLRITLRAEGEASAVCCVERILREALQRPDFCGTPRFAIPYLFAVIEVFIMQYPSQAVLPADSVGPMDPVQPLDQAGRKYVLDRAE